MYKFVQERGALNQNDVFVCRENLLWDPKGVTKKGICPYKGAV